MRHYLTRPRKVDIVGATTSAGRFKSLVQAIKVTGFTEILRGRGPFTLFAPSDAAFAKIPLDRLESLFADAAELADILRNHIVSGRILAADMIRYGNSTPRTLNGRPLPVNARAGRLYVDGTLVSRTDILASNGVVHELEALLPPLVRQYPATQITVDRPRTELVKG
jgi:uncharacterized surface protein with fasciclin (FAS1) repeats